jgi:hypothetical protein
MPGESSASDIQKQDSFGLGVAWNWPFDSGFLRMLHQKCSENILPLIEITSTSLDSVVMGLQASPPTFSTYLDRASDSDPRFGPLGRWADRHCRYVFNRAELASRAEDKATVHYSLIRAGLQTPHTIILPPFTSHPQLPEIDFSMLNGHFAIKPAHGGGSEGVVTNAHLAEHVQSARQQFPEDAYLLQSTIHPTRLMDKEAWFRVLYCCNQVFPCWWDTCSHIYTPLGISDIQSNGLEMLGRITRQIAAVIGLDLFSTEIALIETGNFVVVDYVNNPVDLRLQSEAVDGVPDEIVWNVSGCLVDWAMKFQIPSKPPIIFL